MRRTSRLAAWVIALLAIGLPACGHKATAPDANAALFGTWTGVLTDTTQGALGPVVHQLALTIEIRSIWVRFTLDGSPQPAWVYVMHDPDLIFEVTYGRLRALHRAERVGDSMTGHADWGASRREAWTVNRRTAPSESTRQR